jgi:hypothetical protein
LKKMGLDPTGNWGREDPVASPKHVKVVKRGTVAIEAWRKRNPSSRLDLRGANLNEANLSSCVCESTVSGAVDLSAVVGLDTIHHTGPSTIGIDTFFKSKGKIPEVFLRGAEEM